MHIVNWNVTPAAELTVLVVSVTEGTIGAALDHEYDINTNITYQTANTACVANTSHTTYQ